MARNNITCTITGSTRVTNNAYLAKKAAQAGCTVEYLRANYVTKQVAIDIRKLIKTGEMDAACSKYNLTPDKVTKILNTNSKTKRPK